MSKLTDEQVTAIRAAYCNGSSMAVLAEYHCVSVSLIKNVIRGTRGGPLDAATASAIDAQRAKNDDRRGRNSMFTDQDVIAMRRAHAAGKTLVAIAAERGAHPTTVWHLVSKKATRRRHITS